MNSLIVIEATQVKLKNWTIANYKLHFLLLNIIITRQVLSSGFPLDLERFVSIFSVSMYTLKVWESLFLFSKVHIMFSKFSDVITTTSTNKYTYISLCDTTFKLCYRNHITLLKDWPIPKHSWTYVVNNNNYLSWKKRTLTSKSTGWTSW